MKINMKYNLFKEKYLVSQKLSEGPKTEAQKVRTPEQINGILESLDANLGNLKKDISEATDWSDKSIKNHQRKIKNLLKNARKKLTENEYSSGKLQDIELQLNKHLYDTYEKARKENPKLKKDDELHLLASPGEALRDQIIEISAKGDWTKDKVLEFFNPYKFSGKILDGLNLYPNHPDIYKVFSTLIKFLHDQVANDFKSPHISEVDKALKVALLRYSEYVPQVAFDISWATPSSEEILSNFTQGLEKINIWSDEEVDKLIKSIEGEENEDGLADKYINSSKTVEAALGVDEGVWTERLKAIKAVFYSVLYRKIITASKVSSGKAEEIAGKAKLDLRQDLGTNISEKIASEEINPKSLDEISKDIADALTSVAGKEDVGKVLENISEFNGGYQDFVKTVNDLGKTEDLEKKADGIWEKYDEIRKQLEQFDFKSVTRTMTDEQKEAYAKLEEKMSMVELFAMAARNAITFKVLKDDFEAFREGKGAYKTFDRIQKRDKIAGILTQLLDLGVVPQDVYPILELEKKVVEAELLNYLDTFFVPSANGKSATKSRLDDIFEEDKATRMLFEDGKEGRETLDLTDKQRRELQKVRLLQEVVHATWMNISSDGTLREKFKQWLEFKGNTSTASNQLGQLFGALDGFRDKVLTQYKDGASSEFDLNKAINGHPWFKESFRGMSRISLSKTLTSLVPGLGVASGEDLTRPVFGSQFDDLLNCEIKTDDDVLKMSVGVVKYLRHINNFDAARKIVHLTLKDEFAEAIDEVPDDKKALLKKNSDMEARKLFRSEETRKEVRSQVVAEVEESNKKADDEHRPRILLSEIDNIVREAMHEAEKTAADDIYDSKIHAEVATTGKFQSAVRENPLKTPLADEYTASLGKDGSWSDEKAKFWRELGVDMAITIAVIMISEGVGSGFAAAGNAITRLKWMSKILESGGAVARLTARLIGRVRSSATNIGYLVKGTTFTALHHELNTKLGNESFFEQPDWLTQALVGAFAWGCFDKAFKFGATLKAGHVGKDLMAYAKTAGGDAAKQVEALMAAAAGKKSPATGLLDDLVAGAEKGTVEFKAAIAKAQTQGLDKGIADILERGFLTIDDEVMASQLLFKNVDSSLPGETVLQGLLKSAAKGPKELLQKLNILKAKHGLDDATTYMLNVRLTNLTEVQKGFFASAKFINQPKVRAMYEYLVLGMHLEAAAMLVAEAAHNGAIDGDPSQFILNFTDSVWNAYMMGASFRVAFGGVHGIDKAAKAVSKWRTKPRPYLDKVMSPEVRDNLVENYSYPEGAVVDGVNLAGEFMGSDGLKSLILTKFQDAMARIKKAMRVPLGIPDILEIAGKLPESQAQEFLGEVIPKMPAWQRSILRIRLQTRKGVDAVSAKVRKLFNAERLLRYLDGMGSTTSRRPLRPNEAPTPEEIAGLDGGRTILDRLRNPRVRGVSEIGAAAPTTVFGLSFLAGCGAPEMVERPAMVEKAQEIKAEYDGYMASDISKIKVEIEKDVGYKAGDFSDKTLSEGTEATSYYVVPFNLRIGQGEKMFGEPIEVDNPKINTKNDVAINVPQDGWTEYAIQLFVKDDKQDGVREFVGSLIDFLNGEKSNLRAYLEAVKGSGIPEKLKRYLYALGAVKYMAPDSKAKFIRAVLNSNGGTAILVGGEEANRIISTGITNDLVDVPELRTLGIWVDRWNEFVSPISNWTDYSAIPKGIFYPAFIIWLAARTFGRYRKEYGKSDTVEPHYKAALKEFKEGLKKGLDSVGLGALAPLLGEALTEENIREIEAALQNQKRLAEEDISKADEKIDELETNFSQTIENLNLPGTHGVIDAYRRSPEFEAREQAIETRDNAAHFVRQLEATATDPKYASRAEQVQREIVSAKEELATAEADLATAEKNLRVADEVVLKNLIGEFRLELSRREQKVAEAEGQITEKNAELEALNELPAKQKAIESAAAEVKKAREKRDSLREPYKDAEEALQDAIDTSAPAEQVAQLRVTKKRCFDELEASEKVLKEKNRDLKRAQEEHDRYESQRTKIEGEIKVLEAELPQFESEVKPFTDSVGVIDAMDVALENKKLAVEAKASIEGLNIEAIKGLLSLARDDVMRDLLSAENPAEVLSKVVNGLKDEVKKFGGELGENAASFHKAFKDQWPKRLRDFAEFEKKTVNGVETIELTGGAVKRFLDVVGAKQKVVNDLSARIGGHKPELAIVQKLQVDQFKNHKRQRELEQKIERLNSKEVLSESEQRELSQSNIQLISLRMRQEKIASDLEQHSDLINLLDQFAREHNDLQRLLKVETKKLENALKDALKAGLMKSIWRITSLSPRGKASKKAYLASFLMRVLFTIAVPSWSQIASPFLPKDESYNADEMLEKPSELEKSPEPTKPAEGSGSPTTGGAKKTGGPEPKPKESTAGKAEPKPEKSEDAPEEPEAAPEEPVEPKPLNAPTLEDLGLKKPKDAGTKQGDTSAPAPKKGKWSK